MFTSPTTHRKMIDIHMHLIPGVDDGAEDLMMARMMLLRAREQGIFSIICTPHSEAFDYGDADVKAVFQNLKRRLEGIYPDMKLYYGCEVYCENAVMDRVLDALRTGVYPTMNDTEYVLMEFSKWIEADGAQSCTEAMVKAGYKPIIAHMERYPNLHCNGDLVNRLRDLGALIQVNAYSLFDEENTSVRNWARQLVCERKVDFLGTDAHRSYHRPPCAEYGLNWLYENAEQEYADAISWKNARKLLCE